MGIVELTQNRNWKSVGRFWLYLLRSYFRVKIEGIENVPPKGRVVVVPNHSGFAGADAVILTYVLKRETRRRARILAHRAFFDFSQTLKALSESHGLIKASIQAGVDHLEQEQMLMIFPEGESGNFKASYRRYRLQPFHTGFLRMAIEARAPIVPCIIIGAEESHFNLGNLDISSIIPGLKIPLPINWIPLPAKWRIKFLPAIDWKEWTDEELEEFLENPSEMRRLAKEIQREMQREIYQELRQRKYIYFRQTAKLKAVAKRAAAKALEEVEELLEGDVKKTTKRRKKKPSQKTKRTSV